jgi:hypothetical protein
MWGSGPTRSCWLRCRGPAGDDKCTGRVCSRSHCPTWEASFYRVCGDPAESYLVTPMVATSLLSCSTRASTSSHAMPGRNPKNSRCVGRCRMGSVLSMN